MAGIQCPCSAVSGCGAPAAPTPKQSSGGRRWVPAARFPAVPAPYVIRGEKVRPLCSCGSSAPRSQEAQVCILCLHVSLPGRACHRAHMASVFLSYSKAQAIAHCKHTSVYQHRVSCTGFINFLLLDK